MRPTVIFFTTIFLCLTFTLANGAQHHSRIPRYCLTIGTDRVGNARLSLIQLDLGFTDIASLQNLPRGWQFTIDNENAGNTIFAFAHQAAAEVSTERLHCFVQVENRHVGEGMKIAIRGTLLADRQGSLDKIDVTESDLILERLSHSPAGEQKAENPANDRRYCVGIDYRGRWPHALGGFDLRLAHAAIVAVPTLPPGWVFGEVLRV